MNPIPTNPRISAAFRVWLAVAAATLSSGWLCWNLERRGVDYITRPHIRVYYNQTITRLVPMARSQLQPGVFEYRGGMVPVESFDTEPCRSIIFRMDAAPEKPEFFGVIDQSWPLLQGEVVDEAGRRRFVARPGTRLVDFRPLEFFKAEGANGLPPPTRLEVRIQLKEAIAVALRCRSQPQSDGSGIARFRMDPGLPSVDGRKYADCVDGGVTYPAAQPAARASELLGYMWNFENGASTVRWLVVLVAALVGAGVFAILGTHSPWTAGVGTALWFAGLSLGYCLCIPPMEGPDEPTHFLSYAGLAGDKELTRQALPFSQRVHFDWMKFREWQRFTADDRLAPLTNGWAEHINTIPLEARSRSASTAVLWSLLSASTPGAEAPRVFLWLRCISIVVVSICAGITGALLAGTGPQGPSVGFRILCFLLIPSLPFFAMIVSNYGILIAAGIVLAGAVASLLMDPRPVPLRSMAFGIALSLALMSSRSALPLLGFAGLWMVAQLFIPLAAEKAAQCGVRRVLASWLALAVGACLPTLLNNPEFAAGSARSLKLLFDRIPVPGLEKLPLMVWIFGIITPFALVDILFHARFTGTNTRWLRPASRAILIPAFALAASQVVFLWVPIPTVGHIEAGRGNLTTLDYMAQTLPAAWASFGIGDHDYLTSFSFWVGFGWLDAIPSSLWVSALCALYVGGLLAHWYQVARNQDGVRFLLFAGWGVGLAVYLAGLGSGTFGEGINLHGRYLIVFYLLLLCVAFTGWWKLAERWTASHPRAMAAGVVLAPLLLHGAMYSHILHRYF